MEPVASNPPSGFDKLALSYRWLEYLSFGPFLWRTRRAFLPKMRKAQHALVLGDGDGRFSAALLRLNSCVQVCAVDASSGMLRQLHRRVLRQGDASRLKMLHGDATQELPRGSFDLVCTHFFLDCLTEPLCEVLIRQVSARVTSECCWIVSEFAVPKGLLQAPARLLVHALYTAFALLTGLRVHQLPDYGSKFREQHWHCVSRRISLGGILSAEVWQRSVAPLHPTTIRKEYPGSERLGSSEDDVVGAPYPPQETDAILPLLPGSDPVPNPEPEQPSLGMPDPGIYEGTGGTASLEYTNMSGKGKE